MKVVIIILSAVVLSCTSIEERRSPHVTLHDEEFIAALKDFEKEMIKWRSTDSLVIVVRPLNLEPELIVELTSPMYAYELGHEFEYFISTVGNSVVLLQPFYGSLVNFNIDTQQVIRELSSIPDFMDDENIEIYPELFGEPWLVRFSNGGYEKVN